MWVVHILYSIFEICVPMSQEYSVDSYKDVRRIRNYTFIKICIPFHFAVVALN